MRRRTSPWVLVPAVLALAYAIAVVVAAWQAPDKGFQAFIGRRVADVEPGGPAEAAGLRVGDVIVAADGAPIASTLDYAFRVLDRAPGETVVLGVERGGVRHDVAIAFAPSPPPWAAITAGVLAVFLLALGLVARVGRPDDLDARRFYRCTIAYTVFYVGALSWTRLIVHPELGLPFLVSVFAAPALSFDLSIDFPHRSAAATAARRSRRFTAAASALLALASLGALVVAGVGRGAAGSDGALAITLACVAIELGFILAGAGAGLWFQQRALRAASGRARAQLRWVTAGQWLCFVPAIAGLPFAIADLERFLLVWYRPIVVAIAILWCLSYSLAVLRVRLADVDALIESSLGYAAATGVAGAVYLGVVLAIGWLTGRLVDEAGPWAHLAAGLAAATLFGPVRARVGGWLDRRFFRDRGHYVAALRRVGESLAQLREPEALAREAVEQLVAAVHAERGALYVRTGEVWSLASSSGSYAAGAWPAEPPAEPDGVAVPVPGETAAMLVLGPRRSGALYSSEDRDLLGALAAQLGVALANARAYGQIKLLSRELEGQNAEVRALRDRLEDENRFLRARVDAATGGASLVGGSKAIVALGQTIERVAASDASVLVVGESGTGKGLVARMLHGASARAAGPFLQVDCGAIARGVFESELFGHERGAFTGATRLRRGPIELADGGTLFLDEIGELPLELQPKLLRVLQERTFLRVGGTQPVTVDVRIVAATHRDLADMVARGELREDLYFRLRVVELVVPPLRQRLADLPALCEALVPRLARRAGRPARPVSADALAHLATYAWPGNVRELENVLARALVLGDGPELTVEDLDLPERPLLADAPAEVVDAQAPHDAVMESIERRRLTAALQAANGNQSHAAKALGMPRTTFINKLRRYGLL